MTALPLPVIILFFSSIGWGLTWLPLKQLGEAGMSGIPLILIAFGSAALLLLPLSWRQRQQWSGNWRFLGLIALFGGFANLSFQSAILHGDVIRVMILFYLLPVWSVIGGRLFLGERMDGLRFVTVAAALTGAFLILGGPSVFTTAPNWIDLLAIASGLSFAMNNIVFRYCEPLPLTGKVNAVFIGCAIMATIVLLTGIATPAVDPATDPAVVIAQAGQTDYTVLGWTAAYGMIWIMLITFGTQWGVEQLEAGRAAVIIIMELVAAIISAAWLLDETLEGPALVGGLLIITAALAETFRPNTNNAQAKPASDTQPIEDTQPIGDAKPATESAGPAE